MNFPGIFRDGSEKLQITHGNGPLPALADPSRRASLVFSVQFLSISFSFWRKFGQPPPPLQRHWPAITDVNIRAIHQYTGKFQRSLNCIGASRKENISVYKQIQWRIELHGTLAISSCRNFSKRHY